MLSNISRLLFPEYCVGCGDPAPTNHSDLLCLECDLTPSEKLAESATGIYFLGCYEKAMRHLIRRWKFEGSRRCARYLVKEAHPQLAAILKQMDIEAVCFVPSSDNKRFVVISNYIASEFNIPTVQLLKKNFKWAVRKRKQHGRNRVARYLEIQNSFMPVVNKTTPQRVLLIDDVYTTGATFAEANRVLTAQGVTNVTGFCFAYRPVVLELDPHNC